MNQRVAAVVEIGKPGEIEAVGGPEQLLESGLSSLRQEGKYSSSVVVHHHEDRVRPSTAVPQERADVVDVRRLALRGLASEATDALVAQTAGDLDPVAGLDQALRSAVAAVDPQLPLASVRSVRCTSSV